MVAITIDSSLSLQIGKDCDQHGAVIEEIDGLIRVYKDGHVERPQIVPFVSPAVAPELGVISRDIVIDKLTNIWARFYVPAFQGKKFPLMVYFHGGGFCVGSAAWSCYHEFLAKLAAIAGCIIMSVNYRLAPENPLPAAFDDGIKALMWLKQQALSSATDNQWWSRQCNFCNIFLAGDSAGANIAYNVIIMLGSNNFINPLNVKGTILIQPFFGGEARSNSENYSVESQKSALSLETSDTYWRLALPYGVNRDHPWCNPLVKGSAKLEDSMEISTMVCIAEMDILKDRNINFVNSLKNKRAVVHKGVGHAFHVLSKSQISQTRNLEMMSQIKSFINN